MSIIHQLKKKTKVLSADGLLTPKHKLAPGLASGAGNGCGGVPRGPGPSLALCGLAPSALHGSHNALLACVSERCGGVHAGLPCPGAVPGGCCHRPWLPVTHPGCCTLETPCSDLSDICPGVRVTFAAGHAQPTPTAGSEHSTLPWASPGRAGSWVSEGTAGPRKAPCGHAAQLTEDVATSPGQPAGASSLAFRAGRQAAAPLPLRRSSYCSCRPLGAHPSPLLSAFSDLHFPP